MSNRCPACGSHNTREIHDFRRECMDCREIFDPTMDNGDSEFSDDAEVLASAGFGTDEDYGYFGEDEY